MCIKQFMIISSIAIFTCGLSAVVTGCSDEEVVDTSTPDGEEEGENPEEPDPLFLKDCKIIMDNIKSQNMWLPENDKISGYLSLINEEGAFTDLNYGDTSFGWNDPKTCLTRMKEMAQAYVNPESGFYENEELFTKTVSALGYWNTANPKCDNWFENDIRAPKAIGETLILLRYGKNRVPDELEDSLLEYNGKTPDSQPAGSNKSDIATHYLYRGCLTENKELVNHAVNQVFVSLECVSLGNEGIQYDYSMHSHGPQLYIGGYGEELLKGVINIPSYTAGTAYELSNNQRHVLYKFTNDVYMESIRGHWMFYNVMGRSVARKSSIDKKGIMVDLLGKLKAIDPEHEQDYDRHIRTLNGEGYEGVEKKVRHYYIGDYMSVQAPGYSANVRLSSKRTSKAEHGNNENLKSFFMSDGSTDVAINGDEYLNIFPVWDWARVPGVTNPYMTEIPIPEGWGIPGESDFSGGLTDGKDGLSGFAMVYNQYNNVKMTANKGYFFIDDKIVCLGNSISSEMAENINTTVEQCRKIGDIWCSDAGSVKKVLGKGLENAKYVDWIWHRNIGYVFPDNDKVICAKEEKRTGNWNEISLGSTGGTETMDVMTIYFDHGSKPQNGDLNKYSYIIVPNVTDYTNMRTYAEGNINIAANNATVQAVNMKDMSTIQVIFYKKGELSLDDMVISVDNPCTLMLKKSGTSYQVYFSDPSHRLKSLSVDVTYNGKTKGFSYGSFSSDNVYKGITHETVLPF